MRRARLQVKPNLGPKPGARPAESPAKPKSVPPVTTTRPAPSTTPTSHDGKADNSAQLKLADNKTGDSTAPQPAAHHVGDSGISDKFAHGAKAQSTAGSKSPRRAASTEHVKVLNNSAKSGNVKSDGSGVAAFPSPLSPGRVRSPRKSVGSDQTHAPPKSPGVVSATSSSDKGAEKASGKNAGGVVSSTDNVDSTKKVAASSSIAKPVVRGIRSRFTKVKPNLAEAGKRAVKAPPVAEKKSPEVRKATEDLIDGANLEAEKNTEKEKQTREELTVTAEVTDTESNDAIASEKKAENDDAVSQISTTDQPVLEAEVSNTNRVGLEDNADAASDMGSFSQVSTDLDTENGPGDASLNSDTFAVPDEPKKTAGEKKTRRSKPALPTTEAQPDRSKMKMGDLIYWNPARNPMKKKESKIPQPSASSHPGESTETPSAVSTDDEASNQSDAMPVPQLKIGPDGNIILNIESLVMDNKAGDPTAAQMETIEEDDDRFITCNSFRNKQLLKRWTQHETARFFKALSQVGTDFSLMNKLFPSRTRRDLKVGVPMQEQPML
ncbi:hypothetical protein V1264_002747 [Littorina saxatilis]|uniref:Transcription factor TFIIIB component B'' Myb domain-containing protein n=1 Tax=Littorina saxatilis TaxID=31220 RepID=A0AAN9B4F1_9CAEN